MSDNNRLGLLFWEEQKARKCLPYRKITNNVAYIEKNQVNCEWLDGMPYSSPMCIRSIGLGCFSQYFNNLLLISFTSVPPKNAICNGKYGKHLLSPRVIYKIIWTISHYFQIHTVCKSLRNKINVTKPAPIPMGARLIHANKCPNKSPTEQKHTNQPCVKVSVCVLLWAWIWQISKTTLYCSFSVQTDNYPAYSDEVLQFLPNNNCMRYCPPNWHSQQNQIIWSITETLKLLT